MRKVTVSAKVCPECGSVLIPEQDEAFCDYCKEKIPNGKDYRLTVFWEGSETSADDFEFCSWVCVFKWLKETTLNKKTIHFMNLPYISNSNNNSFEDEYNDFFKAASLVIGREKSR